MSSVRRIICLSNSVKLSECCIAGIDLHTGEWIRPVCDDRYPEDGRVPKRIARLDVDREPELLDILEIPLASSGKNFGFECENLSILHGQWKYIRKAELSEVRRHLKGYPSILHNSIKYVEPSYLTSLDSHQRRSLQLIEVATISYLKDNSETTGWRGSLTTSNGQTLEKLKITDPAFVLRLEDGDRPVGPFLVTVSLSMPYSPKNWDKGNVCWKLIVGIIEIPQTAADQQLSLWK